MKVINLEEAKEHLEQYAQECQTSPVVVTVGGKPAFELLPIRSDDPEFIDRLLEQIASSGNSLRRDVKNAEVDGSLLSNPYEIVSWGLQNRSHQDQKEDAYRLLGIAAMMHPKPRFVA